MSFQKHINNNNTYTRQQNDYDRYSLIKPGTYTKCVIKKDILHSTCIYINKTYT